MQAATADTKRAGPHKGKKRLSLPEEVGTRKISSVHIECVIGRIKSFKILSQVFPNSMSQEVNRV